MPGENPLEHLLDQIGDLLKSLRENDKTAIAGSIPSDIEKRLSQLEEQAALLRDAQQQLFQQAGFSNEEVQKMILEGSSEKTKHRYFFDRAKDLERDARQINMELAVVRSMKAATGKKNEPKSKADEIRARKKKFKRLGGDKGWIPM